MRPSRRRRSLRRSPQGKLNRSDFVTSQLALFAWHEGSRLNPGSLDSQIAIAWIIANRVKAGWGSSDWLKVLEAAPVHASCEPSEMMTYAMPDLWNSGWIKLAQMCTDIYDGTAKDDLTWTPSREGLAQNLPGTDQYAINQSRPSFFYANLNMPIRSWFIEKIIRKSEDHPRTVTIGSALVLFG